MRHLFPLLLAACLLAAPCALANPVSAVSGDQATDQQFAMGTRITSAQLLDLITQNKGKVVMLNFFASWCPPCEDELPGIFRVQQKYGYDALTVIGVSVDDSNEDLDKILKKFPFNFPVYLDTGTASSTFQVSAIPHSVIYDKNGTMVYNEVGYLDEAMLDAMIRKAME